jgi:maltose O-acetyltransferase
MITVGDDVFIGERAIFHASERGIVIGSKVMFGPSVVIMGGDHRFDVIGEYMFSIREKRPEDDQLVVIEDDVWIGARAIILKGVRIGTGSVIGAGSIVTRDVPPYSVYTGSPSQRIRSRWKAEEIVRHKQTLKKK